MHHELYGSGCLNDIKPDVSSLNVASNVLSSHNATTYHHHHQPSHFSFRTMPEYHQQSTDTSTLLHDYHSLWQWASGYGYSQWNARKFAPYFWKKRAVFFFFFFDNLLIRVLLLMVKLVRKGNKKMIFFLFFRNFYRLTNEWYTEWLFLLM